jgi:hypothetical protein
MSTLHMRPSEFGPGPSIKNRGWVTSFIPGTSRACPLFPPDERATADPSLPA